MDERRKPYPFDQFEPKWQAIWEKQQLFHAPNPGEKDFDHARPKFYVLDMFPYPSGAGLHVGHPEGYTATDIIARYKRMRGFNVLHPMGWDAFGLPAEQYAIKSGQHPAITTRENVAKFKNQLKRIGFSYDWQREINTTDLRYYKWTQWIFLQIYNSWFNPATNKAEPISTYSGKNPDEVRLAYVADVPVNWCPELGTVLANEEVVDGKSEIGRFPVVRRPMRQWMLRITAYAERLLNELDGLDWPEGIKLLQRNWIGKSEGAEIDFKIGKSDQKVRVFTTRPDTLYGGTFLVLAPEHSLVDLIVTEEQWPAIREYREKTARKSDLERADLSKDKTGVFTGAYAINPATNEKIPIWIADYVLIGYGTGAIGGVPAHDERDLEFAKKFDLPIVIVVRPRGDEPAFGFTGEGIAINSPVINGLTSTEAKKKITAWLEERSLGKGAVNYKLRDWLFSRQRYWGEPFPIIWENANHRSLSESELPVVPPSLEEYKPTGTGEPPLSKAKDWIRYSEKATRETNVMPQWAGSCWYYLRFCDPHEDQQKMSKSRGNIVNPDDVIDQYGADAFRCYEMFMGPLEQMKPWSMRGVEGVARFLARVWRLLMAENQAGEWQLSEKIKTADPNKAQQKVLHVTIKKVTEDIESFSFNTAISQMMIFVNTFTNVEMIPLSAIRPFLILLNPFAPHIASELWERLNAKFAEASGDITEQLWPAYDDRLLAEDEVEIVIQLNGKLRDRIKMSVAATEEELKTAALSSPKIQDRIAGKTVRKVVVVPKRLVNIVVS